MSIYLNGHRLNIELFPNNETRIDGDEIYGYMNNMALLNTVTLKYEMDNDLIRLMFVKRFLDDQGARETLLRIAYMPYSRMDRRERVNDIFTLKYVADFINHLGFSAIEVIEPHSDVTCAVLNNAYATYPTKDYLNYVLEQICFDKDVDYLFFPDAGAQKRYAKSITGYMTMVGNKVRDFKTGKIEGLTVIRDSEGESSSFNVLIVDDLCSYGGTFKRSAEKLKIMGAREIYLFVTHCEESIFRGELLTSGLIDKVFTTDTLLGACGDEPKIHQISIIGGNN